MEKIAIMGGDILTPLGDLKTTWDGLLQGESGLVHHECPSVSIDYPQGRIRNLAGSGGSWLRLKSLLDCLIVNIPPLPEKTRLFCATTKAAVDELIYGGTDINGQPWQIASYLKRQLNLTAEATTVSGACASGSLAVVQAGMQIAAGECEHAVIIGVDLVAEFILAGFDSLKALSPTAARPFDRNRDGLSLGDGGGWLLLSASEQLQKYSTPPLAWLESWGVSCDATHITAPCRQASGLKSALNQALINTTVPVGGINAHGTGTVYNDAMELLAFRDIFDAAIPVCSVKGALGHSLGAAGVIETVLSVQSLQHNILPPTVGCTEPEEGAGNISGVDALPLHNPAVLSCNSGFGGLNCVLYLTRQPSCLPPPWDKKGQHK